MTTAFLTRKPDSVSCLYYVEGRVNDMSNDKWFCTECGTANSGNFCSECGALRKTDEPVTCTCGFVYTGNFCTNCGARLEIIVQLGLLRVLVARLGVGCGGVLILRHGRLIRRLHGLPGGVRTD